MTTYEVGAVVQFYPTTPKQVVLLGPPAEVHGRQATRVGYAIVVVARSGWVMQTTLRTVVEDGHGMLAIVSGDVAG